MESLKVMFLKKNKLKVILNSQSNLMYRNKVVYLEKKLLEKEIDMMKRKDIIIIFNEFQNTGDNLNCFLIKEYNSYIIKLIKKNKEFIKRVDRKELISFMENICFKNKLFKVRENPLHFNFYLNYHLIFNFPKRFIGKYNLNNDFILKDINIFIKILNNLKREEDIELFHAYSNSQMICFSYENDKLLIYLYFESEIPYILYTSRKEFIEKINNNLENIFSIFESPKYFSFYLPYSYDDMIKYKKYIKNCNIQESK